MSLLQWGVWGAERSPFTVTKELVVRKGLLISLSLAAFLATTGLFAQDDPLQLFARSYEAEGMQINIVHVNNATVDSLFSAPAKYSIRARANQSAMFYVQARPQRDAKLDTNFILEQGGQKHEAKIYDIQNFTSGDVESGTKIDGLLEFNAKLDLSKPFILRNGKASVEFRLDRKALAALQAAAPTAASQ